MFEKSSGNHSPRRLTAAALTLMAAAMCLASPAGRETCLWHDGWEFAADDSKSKWMTANDVGKHLKWKPATLPYDFAIHGDWLADGGGDIAADTLQVGRFYIKSAIGVRVTDDWIDFRNLGLEGEAETPAHFLMGAVIPSGTPQREAFDALAADDPHATEGLDATVRRAFPGVAEGGITNATRRLFPDAAGEIAAFEALMDRTVHSPEWIVTNVVTNVHHEATLTLSGSAEIRWEMPEPGAEPFSGPEQEPDDDPEEDHSHDDEEQNDADDAGYHDDSTSHSCGHTWRDNPNQTSRNPIPIHRRMFQAKRPVQSSHKLFP